MRQPDLVFRQSLGDFRQVGNGFFAVGARSIVQAMQRFRDSGIVVAHGVILVAQLVLADEVFDAGGILLLDGYRIQAAQAEGAGFAGDRILVGFGCRLFRYSRFSALFFFVGRRGLVLVASSSHSHAFADLGNFVFKLLELLGVGRGLLEFGLKFGNPFFGLLAIGFPC